MENLGQNILILRQHFYTSQFFYFADKNFDTKTQIFYPLIQQEKKMLAAFMIIFCYGFVLAQIVFLICIFAVNILA